MKKIKNSIKSLTQAKFRIIGQANAEGRELDRKEDLMVAELEGSIDALKAQLEKPEGSLTHVGTGNLNYSGGAF